MSQFITINHVQSDSFFRHFFLHLTLLVDTICLAAGASVASCMDAGDVLLPTSQKLLLVSFDGFRHDYLQKVDLPNLAQLARGGTQSESMLNIFPTRTFPNHFAIATGVYAETSGVVDNVAYDPLLKMNLSIGNGLPFWTSNPEISPIWCVNELSNSSHWSGVVMWPGSDIPYKGHLPAHIALYNNSIPFSDRVDVAVSWFLDQEKPAKFVALYFEEPDSTGHKYGPDSEEMKRVLRKVDDAAGYLVNKLKEQNLFDKTDIILLSDHGMTKITKERVIDLNKYVDPSKYIRVTYSPVLSIIPYQGFEEEVYSKLKFAEKSENFSVYLKDELPEHWHLRHNIRTTPLVVAADVGYVFQDFNFSGPGCLGSEKEAGCGTHGYDNLNPEMRPLFIAHGPSFRKGLRKTESFQNVDLFPLFCHLLGITSVPANNGSFDRVKDILANRSTACYKPIVDANIIITGVAISSVAVTAGCLINFAAKSWKQHNGRNGSASFNVKTSEVHYSNGKSGTYIGSNDPAATTHEIQQLLSESSPEDEEVILVR